MTYDAGANIIGSRQIAAFPFIIETLDENVALFLAGLPTPDFSTTLDTNVDWATQCIARYEGGSEGGGSAWVVSAQTFKRIKAHRY